MRRTASGAPAQVATILVDGTGTGSYRYALPNFNGTTFQAQGIPWTFTAEFVGDTAYRASTSNPVTWHSHVFNTYTYFDLGEGGTGLVSGGFRLRGYVYSTGPLNETPTGSVRFTANEQVIGTVQLDSAGRFNFLAPTPSGTTTYVAQYLGDTWHSGSTNTYQFTLHATTTSLTAVADYIPEFNSIPVYGSPSGQSILLTAHVSESASGTPAGTVNFFAGTTPVGSGTLNSDSNAYLWVASFPGTLTFTAQYAGQFPFAPSVSASVPFKFNTTLTSSWTCAGNVVRATATLSSSGFMSVAGKTISFSVYANNVPPQPPALVVINIGTAPTNASGVATLDWNEGAYDWAGNGVGVGNLFAAFAGDLYLNAPAGTVAASGGAIYPNSCVVIT